MADGLSELIKCPYGHPGDVLIGREAFCEHVTIGGHSTAIYKATFTQPGGESWRPNWRTASCMPASLSRIRRELVAVECVQVHDLTYEQAIALGVYADCFRDKANPPYTTGDMVYCHFKALYPGVWESNSWGWILTLKSE